MLFLLTTNKQTLLITDTFISNKKNKETNDGQRLARVSHFQVPNHSKERQNYVIYVERKDEKVRRAFGTSRKSRAGCRQSSRSEVQVGRGVTYIRRMRNTRSRGRTGRRLTLLCIASQKSFSRFVTNMLRPSTAGETSQVSRTGLGTGGLARKIQTAGSHDAPLRATIARPPSAPARGGYFRRRHDSGVGPEDARTSTTAVSRARR